MSGKKNVPVITGYYRWTDIYFHWPDVLPNAEDRPALKALIAHGALVHEDHPLHPGVTGVTLYIGTFASGESRLLMSSAQVDYLRYWLHAMQLTKEMIPLPYSDCLLTRSNLSGLSPIEIKDGLTLKQLPKKIDKSNKRLTRGNVPGLPLRRHLFQLVRAYWREKKGVWCAIDIEAWERDHDVTTELGYSLVRWENEEEVTETAHLIIEEHMMYTNGVYVQGNRDHYNFGKSEVLNKVSFKKRVNDLFKSMAQHGPIFLIFHDSSQDVKYLEGKDIGAPIKLGTHILPDSFPVDGIFYIDTSVLFGGLMGSGDQKKSLEKTCHLLGIETQFMHNAGNDAHYTMLALKSMASGPDLDTQREERWPRQLARASTSTNPSEIPFDAWDEDGDYDEDMEGMFPPTGPYDVVTGKLNEGTREHDEEMK